MNSVAQNPYQLLVEDCRQIVVEHEFMSRWTLIEGYHALGKRILQEELPPKRVTQLSRDIGKSRRTVEKAIQFARMYPDLEMLPEGKNISWHKISNKYLTESTDKKEESIELVECPNCHVQWPK